MNICITGVSKGLGLSLSQSFVHAGHAVWGVARTPPASAHLPAERYRSSVVDVSSPDDVARWRREMTDAGFVPDVLVLNASIQDDDLAPAGYDHQLGHRTLSINLDGALACVAAFLPDFLKRAAGMFLFVNSTVALRPSVRSAAYAASKAGLAMACRTLRLAYAPRGVRFKMVTLGPLRTAMWEGRESWLVPSPERAAARIARFVQEGGDDLYYPALSTALLRLSLPLPDRWFAAVSAKVLK